MKKNSLGRYFWTGLKLMIILILGGLIMLIPRILIYFTISLSPIIFGILYLITVILGIIVAGYLLIKFKKWIFR